jgi:hypothetical protein
MIALVVPDSVTVGSTVDKSYISFNCKGDRKSMRKKLESDLYAMLEKYKDKKGGSKSMSPLQI